jgi:UDP-galactopyranose mutase
MKRVLIVGAGFAGTVCARLLAEQGHHCKIIERRKHVGGNAFDEYDSNGVLIHRYGPHIFHTNSKNVFQFLSRFTAWRFYEHRVLASVEGKLYPIPINKTTINELYKLSLDDEGIKDYLRRVSVRKNDIKTSEDVVLASVGHDLCDKFFRNYTLKQWGLPLHQLSAGVAARIPTRTNDDDRYFEDQFQFVPGEGYTRMFEKMLDHPNIKLELECPYDQKLFSKSSYDHLIFTGQIDEYYRFRYGRLPYRSLRFEFQHFGDCESFQRTGTVNYPNDFNYTRITEFKKITGQIHPGSTVVFEFPSNDGDPFYPVPNSTNNELYKCYTALADQESSVTFVGRLAQYKYYNMDQVVASAIAKVNGLLQIWGEKINYRLA